MSAGGRRTLAAALTVAAVLIAPSIASAQIFTVSQDVKLYETPDTSKPIRSYPAGGRVDVRCWTKGQAIGGYAVWDRIKNGNNGFAYVHDKYVEMPGGKSPAQMGIDSCGDTGEPLPPVGTCARGDRVVRYLSERLPLQRDHSYAKLTWLPRMCVDSDGWTVRQAPELDTMSAGSSFGIGVELEANDIDGPTASYHGQIMNCVPFSISYSGIGFSGVGCHSLGTVDLAVTVKDGKIGTPSFRVKGKGIQDYAWTKNVL
jgi:hypothetical protein